MAKNEQEKLKKTRTLDGEDISAYYRDLQRYKPLPREEEQQLIKQYKENNDLLARQKLITSNLRYAFSLVNKYKNRGVPLSDLLEEANCGLIESIDKFDETRDVKVITYARWKMEYKIQKALNEHDKMPENDLPEDYDTQISDEASYSDEYSQETYNNEAFIDEETEIQQTHNVNTLDSIIQVLDERETDIIKMYFGISPYEKEYTYQEIGEKYKLTKERIRQLIDKIMRKLRVQALTILNE